MKKNTLSIFVLFLAVLVVLGSCKKEDPTSLVLDDTKTATISGTVYAQLDLSNGDIENAPSGTKLFFKVQNNQYIAGGQGTTIYEVTVGAGGSYSLTLPVTDEGIDVVVEAEDFEYNVVQFDGTTTEETIFTGGVMTTVNDVITNGNYLRNIYY